MAAEPRATTQRARRRPRLIFSMAAIVPGQLLGLAGRASALAAEVAGPDGGAGAAGGAGGARPGLVAPAQTQAAPLTLALCMLALGACNGSLAELISRRLPEQRSLWWPPSGCEACGRRLRWWHNLPVFSYPCLRGRCAYCRVAIPPRTWVVEVTMAAVGWALWWRLGLDWPLLLWLPLTVPIMAVALCDIDHWWVPDPLALAAAAWVLVCTCLPGGRPWALVATGLVPAALLWGVGWAFARARGFEGLGLGDVKWAAVMGAAVGGPAACSMIFWASLQAAAAGLAWRGRCSWRGRRQTPPPLSLSPPPGPAVPPVAVPAALVDDADWQPPDGALPFAPFIGLAALETVLCPQVFALGAGPLLTLMGYSPPY